MRFDGKLASWNDGRGFGFIQPLQGGQEIFVHILSFPEGTGRPRVGLVLSFEVEMGPQGKKRAKAVQFAQRSRRLRAESPAPWTLPRLLAIPVFVAVYAAVAVRWPVSPWVAAAYAAMSVATFVVYGHDKSAARQGQRRTPESNLHALALACGWPGALLAQQWLRHKCAKPSFVATFWRTVVANVAGFVAACSPLGRLLLA